MDDAHLASEQNKAGRGAQIAERYMGATYRADNPDWHEGDAAWKAAQVAELIKECGIAPRTICDIGCGTGGVLDKLRDLLPDRPNVTGYEQSPQALSIVPGPRKERVEFIAGSHESDDRVYDMLLCLDVFEHVEDYYGFLRAIRSKAPLAIFHIPIDTAVTTVLRPGPILRSSQKVGHIQHYTPAAALEALRYAGYSVLDARLTAPALAQRATTPRQRFGNVARLVASRINRDVAARLMTGFSLLAFCDTNQNSDGHELPSRS